MEKFDDQRYERNKRTWSNRKARWDKFKSMTSQERFNDWKRKHPSRMDEENPYFLKDRD